MQSTAAYHPPQSSKNSWQEMEVVHVLWNSGTVE
jgi:hypothetical protein